MADSELAVEFYLAAISALILILVVSLPLLPAILIYKIFPNTNIKASGTIGALTWNASGAFAAYMIVLAVIMLSPLKQLTSAVGGFYSPTWTVEMEIHGYDGEANPAKFDDIDVVLNPDMHRISEDKVILKIPGLKRSEWPIVQLNVDGGTKKVNLASLNADEIDVDYYRKYITLLSPVQIKQVSTSRESYPQPGSGYLNQ